MKQYAVAVVGATGLVGATLLALLEERKFPIDKLFPIASQKSKDKKIYFDEKKYSISDLESFDFSQSNIAFFCISNDLAAKYVPKAAALGNVVIDKSFHYRNHRDVPLIIPEVNLSALAHYQKLNIIANPNCNTIPIAVAIKPIYDAVGISRMNIATYQSVSGAGKEAIVELKQQSQLRLSGQIISTKTEMPQIAFNVLPHIDEFQDNGYTREEMKIVWEIQKIFNDTSLAINPTAVRVPVFCGHAAAVHLETKDTLTVAAALELLGKAPGIQLSHGKYPYATPWGDAEGKDEVYVGRVHKDISHANGINLWVVADNLRKGAALNAVQTAEHLIKQYLS